MNYNSRHQDYIESETNRSCTSYDVQSHYEVDTNFRPTSHSHSPNKQRHKQSRINTEKSVIDNIPRDNTDLKGESKLRHLKTVGAFLGSTLGFMVFGSVGCIAGGGCGLWGGREVMKHVKSKREMKNTERDRSLSNSKVDSDSMVTT